MTPPTPSRRTESRIRAWAIALLLPGLALVAACGDGGSPAEPDPPVVPAPRSFAVEIPDTVLDGQAFSLEVTALKADGTTAETAWSGTAQLSVTSGAVSPATVPVVAGRAVAQVTLQGAAGSASISAAASGASGNAGTYVVGRHPAARLEIAPTGLLLREVGETASLTARAWDAEGRLTQAAVAWTSTGPGMVSVTEAGLARAEAPGSARIRATSGALTDEVFAVVTRPADGVITIPDEVVLPPDGGAPPTDPRGWIVPVDPEAVFDVGWRYRVRMAAGAAPPAGSLVVGTGGIPLAGRVVAVQPAVGGDEVTLEVIPLDQLLPDLEYDEEQLLDDTELVLTEQASAAYESRRTSSGEVELTPRDGALPAPTWLAGSALTDSLFTFRLGPFKCKTKLASLPLQFREVPTFRLRPRLSHRARVRSGRLELLELRGGLDYEFKMDPKLAVRLEGAVDCKGEVFEIPVRGFGPVALILGASVPVGVGFELKGSVTVAEVGFAMRSRGGIDLVGGMDCSTGECTTYGDVSGAQEERVFEPILPDVDEQPRVEIQAYAFAFASPSTWGLELVDIRGGVALNLDLATPTAQAANPDYASGFGLSVMGLLKPGSDLDPLLRVLGMPVVKLELRSTVPLDESPRGEFTIEPGSVRAGTDEEVGELTTFRVRLGSSTFLTLDAVDGVEFFRRVEDGGQVSLTGGPPGCATVAATPGQTEFTCTTLFTEDDLGDNTFVAFVRSRLFGVPIPIPLEVARDSRASVEVTPAEGAEVYFQTFDSGAGGDWSTSVVATAPSGQRFLGIFGNDAPTLTLNGLPAHQKVIVELDLYTFNSMDGNDVGSPGDVVGPDVIEFLVDGVLVKRTTFANVFDPEGDGTGTPKPQAYPGDHPGANNPPGTGSTVRNSLGYQAPAPDEYWADVTYRLRFEVPHTGGAVSFRVQGVGQQGYPNEGWGLDNVRVIVEN